jgi:spore coat polysaccharide biosynthesis predicted glycosyltransferase SpsG/RimJ/RimL family protein N-acetyltransferase
VNPPAHVRLRPATRDDGPVMLAWQQDPRTRRHFRNPAPPTAAEHSAWLERRLTDPAGALWMIEAAGAPAGVVRLDAAGPGAFEVAILVDPARHRRGIGAAALAFARAAAPAAELRAEVLAGNDASHALFRRAGYVGENGHYVCRSALARPAVALHADGGPEVGLGHFARVRGLAAALAGRGAGVFLVVAPESGLAPLARSAGLAVVEGPTGPADLLRAAAGAALLVADSYRLDVKELAARNGGRLRLAVFDDTAERDLPVDAVINGSPAAPLLPYAGRTAGRLLLGPEYQILRADLRPAPGRDGPARRLLVLVGGADLDGVAAETRRLAEERLAPAWPELAIDLVFGPLMPPPLPSALPNLRLHHAPADLPALMAAADLALSAGGQTLFELARARVPTVAFCLGDDQRRNLEALAARGAVAYIGRRGDGAWTERAERTLAGLVGDAAGRRALAEAAGRLFDGQGAGRLAAALLADVLLDAGRRG